ncbi:hypothetical protein SK77_00313 [Escherichia coli]|nr:hypothetical protein SK77_00313 [Escherichia coli]
MREQIKQDIDLIEILFYLKKKIRVILFIMAICMAMVLLFLYINKDNIKVIYSLKINQTTPGILVSCDSNNNFACQTTIGFAPIFPDICYHLTHYKPAAADIPVASDNPAHYADAIRYNARTPLQGSLLPLTRLVWA